VILRIKGALALGATVGSLLLGTLHPVPVHAATSGWLDRFNAWRQASNVSALSENPTFSQGDYNHSQYMVKNDTITHYEVSTLPYFTAAGDTAARNGNIQVSSTTSATDDHAIDWWMAAPFHALGMMDPRLTSTGFGAYREVKSGWQAGFSLDVLRGNSFSGGAYPVFFPGNNSTVPLTQYSGNESPDPLASCPGYTMPAGLPVFVQVGGNVATSVAAHAFTGNGVPLTHCVIDSSDANVGSSLKSRGAVIIVPRQPLQPGVSYTVALTVNAIPYTWTFGVSANNSIVPGGAYAGCTSGTPLAGDYNGDGKTDLALVSGFGVCVLPSTGTGFAPHWPATGPFYGTKTTLVGDITGTGKASLVAVNSVQTFVMVSNGTGFGAPAVWANVPFYGTRGTFLADVNGDGKADLVAVNDSNVWVMPSTGTGFAAPVLWSNNTPFYGNVATLIGDVTGTGKASLIAVNSGSTWVMTSNGASFTAPAVWSTSPFYGNVATLVGDVAGTAKAGLVAVNAGNSWVMTSTGSSFSAPAVWSLTAFYGTQGTIVGDVVGTGKKGLLAVNPANVWVAASTGAAFSAPALWM
jgi:hypothetical protein